MTIIEKIISNHSGKRVVPGDIVDIAIDVRVARDFGGANVVKNIRDANLTVADPSKTFFTFDCNPGGSDQKYASNQQLCRIYARETGISTYDINSGIGTHLAIDEGLAVPGSTLVSTDSHANILGAIGAFGQGMGDQDIAHAFAYGRVWFEVPKTIKVILKGKPGRLATPKDVVLALLRHFGANGLLGYAAEFYGDYVDKLDLSGRITIASMATEMGAIIMLFPPNEKVIEYCERASGKKVRPVYADRRGVYENEVEIDIDGMEPLISRPGHPEDVVAVSEVHGRKIDSAFIGSCTNGRYEDMVAAAKILAKHKVAPGVVLKIVPSTDKVWRKCLDRGLVDVFKKAGVLFGNAGCAGCADGQIGQNGPGEVTVSTGNRNFTGKQGRGEVYLASPATVAASAAAGFITTADKIPGEPGAFPVLMPKPEEVRAYRDTPLLRWEKPVEVQGRVWVINKDNIDTDMIYHNRYLTITEKKEMGQYTFSNLRGYEDSARKAKPGDIVVTAKNFGAGSSRQQAVDCFQSLGISVIVAESFGAIYQRNAINAGMPILISDLIHYNIRDSDEIKVNFQTGEIVLLSTQETLQAKPFSDIQMKIYQKGGLLKA